MPPRIIVTVVPTVPLVFRLQGWCLSSQSWGGTPQLCLTGTVSLTPWATVQTGIWGWFTALKQPSQDDFLAENWLTCTLPKAFIPHPKVRHTDRHLYLDWGVSYTGAHLYKKSLDCILKAYAFHCI